MNKSPDHTPVFHDQKTKGTSTTGHRMKVYVWDMDETLILLKSLLNGTYAAAFNGAKDAQKGKEIGEHWEKHILQVCDEFFFYEQIENYNEPCLDALREYDDGRDLFDYDFCNDGFAPPYDDPNKRKLAYRHRVITQKYAQGLHNVLDQDKIKLWEDLYNLTDTYTDGWLSSGQMLMDDHPTLFWTPCAAHCIDLMLHDICKLPIITTTVKRAIALNGYIYNHPYVLNMMRTFTEQKELIRPGVTRFATVFLTLQSIYNQKNKLRRMFTSEEWSTSRYHRDTKGKDAYETVLSPGFWNNILYSLRATGPLVRVLRMVDSEKKPAMGYIYEAMDRAKEAISKSFNYNEAKYYEIWEIIDKRWNDQLHRSLHAAGYYLNPEYFYTTPRIESNEELNDGFLKTMARLVPDEGIQHLVETELSLYRYAQGVMGSPNAIRNRALWSPARAFLEQCSDKNEISHPLFPPESSTASDLKHHSINVLVTSGSLVPSLVKCLLFRLDGLIAPENVYSSWEVGKLQCFSWIKERFGGPNVRFCVIGDGFEECEAAQNMRWPFIRIDPRPGGSHRFPGLTVKLVNHYMEVIYGNQDSKNGD